MTRRAALVLRASAIWAVWVWAVLIRNMLTDHTHGWSFRAVHIGLAVVSIAFAIATWQIAATSRRAARAAQAAQVPCVLSPGAETDRLAEPVPMSDRASAPSGTS